MSLGQEDEAKEQQRLIQAEIDSLNAANAVSAPLRALQLENALASESQIKRAREGGITVDDSTHRDFNVAREALDERFRRAGTYGSTEHNNAINDFNTKKAETLAALREGRLTHLQQRANFQNERLQSNLTAGRNTSRTISDILNADTPQGGFSRANLVEQFKTGAADVFGQAVRGPVQSALTRGVSRVGSKIGGLFTSKKAASNTFLGRHYAQNPPKGIRFPSIWKSP